MAPPVAPAAGATKADVRDQSALEQRLGQSTSVIMPLLEFGAIGYVTWVLVYQICIEYLIDPSAEFRHDFNIQPRRATGIALIVVYAVLLLLLLIPWLRLLQVIWSRPDLTPLGDVSLEKKEVTTTWLGEYDAYICDYEGMPLWCDKCHNWKPDRTHHCKELGRCVRKMDHYCPWAGGIIAETTHKFFMQFVSFGALYTAYAWIVSAVFLGERIAKTGSRPGTWIGVIAVAVLFCIFTFTMSCMTGWNLCINYTSVEGIQRGGVQNIAFLIATPERSSLPSTLSSKDKSQDHDDWSVLTTIQRGTGRTYVVMQTKPHEHPWYTSLMMGWKDVMGNNILDWLTPIKHSPNTHKSNRGEFEWGELVYDMARQYEAHNPGVKLALLY
ncbi:Protein S-acyltransferase [Ascochyta rabiei]|uniref:Palmitoyltransferase n=1 Tax=Didymella rabiei TaxID=5454 RepID=A0A163D3D8_DIDRA|nr:Protein S-acyltransferase [Ascochyta rabiei]KZM22879.1 protein-cysteine S-palmitoyltransferase [Ascochyta rabiei]UPX10604.1 Protein S-acyltransferase [Ascochyta rabiei]